MNQQPNVFKLVVRVFFNLQAELIITNLCDNTPLILFVLLHREDGTIIGLKAPNERILIKPNERRTFRLAIPSEEWELAPLVAAKVDDFTELPGFEKTCWN